MKVLIIGISGGVGRLVAERLLLADHEVLGIDVRPWPGAPGEIEVHRADVRKRPAEDVFRTRRPDAVIHMGTVTHFSAGRERRYRINLGGTRAVFERCARYDVGQVIFVGRHTYYGAAPDTPLYHTESDPPLAVSTFPELADMVAADLYAGTALWRHPSMTTAVLRMCYTLGPTGVGNLATYLAGPYVPTILGFDPLYQFMHENDAVTAICAALDADLKGVFNVRGPDPVPLSLLIRATDRVKVPLPASVFPLVTGKFGLPHLPAGAVNHLKHPIVVDDTAFRAATGFAPTWDEAETMDAFRWA